MNSSNINKLLFITLIYCGVIIFIIGCSKNVTISEINSHPRNYVNKEVSIEGKVTERFSLAIINYFQIADETDSIYVISNKPFPAIGEKIRITGRVEYFSFGNMDLLTIIEEND